MFRQWQQSFRRKLLYWCKLVSFIWEMLGSHLHWDMNYPEWGFSLSSIRKIQATFKPWPLPSKSIFCWSFICHPTILYCIVYLQAALLNSPEEKNVQLKVSSFSMNVLPLMFQSLKVESLVDCSGETNSQWIISLISKKYMHDNLFWHSHLFWSQRDQTFRFGDFGVLFLDIKTQVSSTVTIHFKSFDSLNNLLERSECF
jgi:hypothetical protein